MESKTYIFILRSKLAGLTTRCPSRSRSKANDGFLDIQQGSKLAALHLR